MHARFNKWELESSEGSWFELKPAGAPSGGGADWWSASIQAGSEFFCVGKACVRMTPDKLGCVQMGKDCPRIKQPAAGML